MRLFKLNIRTNYSHEYLKQWLAQFRKYERLILGVLVLISIASFYIPIKLVVR